MNTHYLTTVRRLFSNPLAPDSTNRHNQRAWIKSVRMLGDKWLLAKQVGKL